MLHKFAKSYIKLFKYNIIKFRKNKKKTIIFMKNKMKKILNIIKIKIKKKYKIKSLILLTMIIQSKSNKLFNEHLRSQANLKFRAASQNK